MGSTINIITLDMSAFLKKKYYSKSFDPPKKSTNRIKSL